MGIGWRSDLWCLALASLRFKASGVGDSPKNARKRPEQRFFADLLGGHAASAASDEDFPPHTGWFSFEG
jgi:hypothetical protein